MARPNTPTPTKKFIDSNDFLTILASEGVDFLLSPNEKKVALSSCVALAGHSVFLFFSANWCRPCRTFTPKLVQLYNTLRNHIEIIFVSLDRDDHAFNQHFNSMPWLAVPFHLHLCKRFPVHCIPSLIPLATDNSDEGILIQEELIELIEDYGAEAFPFTSKRRDELKAIDDWKRHDAKLEQLISFGGQNYLISRDHREVMVSELAGKKTVGLYFGAHWSPPCHNFNSQLIQVYKELETVTVADEGGGCFEIVLVSTDRNKEEFNVNISSMPWLAIPYEDSRTRQDLCRIFNIKAIPALVLIGANDKTITPNGKEIIGLYGARAYPFTESRIEEIKANLRKEGEALPRQVKDAKHEHELKLEMAKAYVCDSCRDEGRFWAFSCDVCDYDLHPTCVEETFCYKN